MSASVTKQILAKGIGMLGWYSWKCRKIKKNKAVIFMYHRVLPKDYKSVVPIQPGMYVTPASLRLQLEYLKSTFTITPLPELVSRIQKRQDVSHCCVITFDDGWQDNYQYAYPVLCELKIPATIFLTTGFIGTDRWFWPEELAWCIKSLSKKTQRQSLFPPELLTIINGVGNAHENLVERIDRVVEDVKSWVPVRRECLISECVRSRQAASQGRNERLLLNWEEVREMEGSGFISFGSHTVSHALLDQISLQEFKSEIAESRKCLEMKVDNPVDSLAYPNGNYLAKDFVELKKMGISAAVTTERGLVDDKTHLYKLPRIAIHEDASFTRSLFQWRLFVR